VDVLYDAVGEIEPTPMPLPPLPSGRQFAFASDAELATSRWTPIFSARPRAAAYDVSPTLARMSKAELSDKLISLAVAQAGCELECEDAQPYVIELLPADGGPALADADVPSSAYVLPPLPERAMAAAEIRAAIASEAATFDRTALCLCAMHAPTFFSQQLARASREAIDCELRLLGLAEGCAVDYEVAPFVHGADETAEVAGPCSEMRAHPLPKPAIGTFAFGIKPMDECALAAWREDFAAAPAPFAPPASPSLLHLDDASTAGDVREGEAVKRTADARTTAADEAPPRYGLASREGSLGQFALARLALGDADCCAALEPLDAEALLAPPQLGALEPRDVYAAQLHRRTPAEEHAPLLLARQANGPVRASSAARVQVERWIADDVAEAGRARAPPELPLLGLAGAYGLAPKPRMLKPSGSRLASSEHALEACRQRLLGFGGEAHRPPDTASSLSLFAAGNRFIERALFEQAGPYCMGPLADLPMTDHAPPPAAAVADEHDSGEEARSPEPPVQLHLAAEGRDEAAALARDARRGAAGTRWRVTTFVEVTHHSMLLPNNGIAPPSTRVAAAPALSHTRQSAPSATPRAVIEPVKQRPLRDVHGPTAQTAHGLAAGLHLQGVRAHGTPFRTGECAAAKHAQAAPPTTTTLPSLPPNAALPPKTVRPPPPPAQPKAAPPPATAQHPPPRKAASPPSPPAAEPRPSTRPRTPVSRAGPSAPRSQPLDQEGCIAHFMQLRGMACPPAPPPVDARRVEHALAAAPPTPSVPAMSAAAADILAQPTAPAAEETARLANEPAGRARTFQLCVGERARSLRSPLLVGLASRVEMIHRDFWTPDIVLGVHAAGIFVESEFLLMPNGALDVLEELSVLAAKYSRCWLVSWGDISEEPAFTDALCHKLSQIVIAARSIPLRVLPVVPASMADARDGIMRALELELDEPATSEAMPPLMQAECASEHILTAFFNPVAAMRVLGTPEWGGGRHALLQFLRLTRVQQRARFPWLHPAGIDAISLMSHEVGELTLPLDAPCAAQEEEQQPLLADRPPTSTAQVRTPLEPSFAAASRAICDDDEAHQQLSGAAVIDTPAAHKAASRRVRAATPPDEFKSPWFDLGVVHAGDGAKASSSPAGPGANPTGPGKGSFFGYCAR
jgi:hypothetical protein